MKIQNYIGGQFTTTMDYLENINPTNQALICLIPRSTKQDVDQAVLAAKNAQSAWADMPVSKRCQYLEQIANNIEKRFDEFALAETVDTGKPLALSKKIDIPRAIENFRFFAQFVSKRTQKTFVKNEQDSFYVENMPVGVGALITPWNLPLYLLTWKIAPAIACGNAVVCKPSEMTPMTAYLLCQIFDEVGLPKGVVNVVFGTGIEVGQPLVVHRDVNFISFTGGTQTGKAIEKATTGLDKKISMELGGKNPILIDKDVDIEKTANWLVQSSFLNQGQICLCGERVLIHEDIFEALVKVFAEKTKSLKVGDPLDEKNFMGPLVSKEHLEKVKRSIDAWKEAGASVLAGDEALPEGDGNYQRPVILSSVDKNHPCHTQEIFGPVVTVEPFSDMDEAVSQVNESPYGLCASVFCNDLDKAKRLASKLEVSTVWINCWLVRDLRVPFGGMKASGVGREGGEYSMDFYTETKTIGVRVEGDNV